MGHLFHGGGVGGVDNDDGAVGGLGNTEQTGHGLGLQIVGAGLGMAAHAVLPCCLFLGNEGVDDAAIFTVDAAETATGMDGLHGLVHRAVTNHHGGIGHVHLEGGDACGEHIVQLGFNTLVPVVDGHVETVVALALLRLFVPQLQTVTKALPLIGAGEVDDGGGAAAKGGAGAGVEIIGGGGVAHIQIEMGMGIDEAGQQQLSAAIHHLVGALLNFGCDADNLLAVTQHIGAEGGAAADHRAATE